MANKRVLVVGSAEESAGGVATVIRTMKKMPVWEEFHCRWLGTQIQRNYLWKLWYAIKANFIALFIVWRYDIVHFHTTPDRIGLLTQLPILLLAKFGHRKVIMHLHVGNQLEKSTEVSLFRWWLKHSDMIVFLANRFLEIYKTHYPEITTEAICIYNSCENVVALPYEQHEKYVLFAGAFRPNKGADLLIEAFAKVSHDNPDWRLKLLGDGPELEKYSQLIHQYEIEDLVEIPGYIVGNEKEKYFQYAGIYAMCSYMEGFPMVVIDSWNYGIPVVSTPVGGIPDVAVEGKNIVSFKFGDSDDLASKLSMMIVNENMRREMSVFSRNFVQQKFSMESVNEQWEQLYQTI